MTLTRWERKLVVCFAAVAVSLLVAIALSGCAVFEARETFVACRAADTITTIQVVRHGGQEMNPMLKGLVMGHHWLAFIALEAGASWMAWHFWPDIPKEAKPALNVLSCAPIPNNIAVLRDIHQPPPANGWTGMARPWYTAGAVAVVVPQFEW